VLTGCAYLHHPDLSRITDNVLSHSCCSGYAILLTISIHSLISAYNIYLQKVCILSVNTHCAGTNNTCASLVSTEGMYPSMKILVADSAVFIACMVALGNVHLVLLTRLFIPACRRSVPSSCGVHLANNYCYCAPTFAEGVKNALDLVPLYSIPLYLVNLQEVSLHFLRPNGTRC
jgi:hypothetical protein